MYVTDGLTSARELELSVALRMAQEGYAGEQVFALNGTARDAEVLEVAGRLADQIDAQAVFVMGEGDRDVVEEFAAEVRLVVFDINRAPRRPEAVSGG